MIAVHEPPLVSEEMGQAIDSADLRRRASEIQWYHRIDLGDGYTTAGVNDPTLTLRRLGLPSDLRGKSVLDVGAWDGFYSFEAERRGAARVLATDSYSWDGGGWGTKSAFELAREALGSGVEDRTIDVFALSPASVGTFDLVLFLGVLYHLRDPIGALEHIASVTSGQLILETEVDYLLARRPVAAFYPTVDLNSDPTNWWGPNPAAVLGMLRAAGFSRAEVAWTRSSAARVLGWARHRRSDQRRSVRDALQRNRAVFHAWKV